MHTKYMDCETVVLYPDGTTVTITDKELTAMMKTDHTPWSLELREKQDARQAKRSSR